MRVAFVFPHISHGSPGSFQRTYLMCKALMECGISIVIYTPFKEDKNILHDVDISLLPSIISKLRLSSLTYKVARRLSASSLTSKILLSERSLRQMARSITQALDKVLEKRKFDIIHAVQQPTALGCIPAARKHNIPLVTDVHNIWVEEAISGQHGRISSQNKVFVGLKEIEREVLHQSDAITVPTDHMKKYMTSNFQVPEDRITIVPHGGFLVNNLNLAQNRQENVIYSGMVSRREHVDLFANSIPFVKSHAIFYISNYGEMLSHIKEITSRPNYPHVNYVWFKDRKEILDVLGKSKIGILTSSNDTARQLGPPVKLFEYLSCGLPVIANDIGGWSEIINKLNVGMTTRDNPRSFAEAIDTILMDQESWYKMHKNCLEAVRTKYNWSTTANEILIPLYQQIVRTGERVF